MREQLHFIHCSILGSILISNGVHWFTSFLIYYNIKIKDKHLYQSISFLVNCLNDYSVSENFMKAKLVYGQEATLCSSRWGTDLGRIGWQIYRDTCESSRHYPLVTLRSLHKHFMLVCLAPFVLASLLWSRLLRACPHICTLNNLGSSHWIFVIVPQWFWHCVCVCFRCEGCRQQLPGPVGVHQWYHRSDGTGVKGTQLSGIPALLRGNAVMWLANLFFQRSPRDLCFALYCFWYMPVLLLLLYLWVGGGKKRERLHCTLTCLTLRGKIRTSEYLRYKKDKQMFKSLFPALILPRFSFMFPVLKILPFKKRGREKRVLLNLSCSKFIAYLCRDHVPEILTAWGSLLQQLTGNKQNYRMLNCAQHWLGDVKCVCVCVSYTHVWVNEWVRDRRM